MQMQTQLSRTDDSKTFQTLSILEQHLVACLDVHVKRKLNSANMIDALSRLLTYMPCQSSGPTIVGVSWLTHWGIRSLPSLRRAHVSSRDHYETMAKSKALTPGFRRISCSTGNASAAPKIIIDQCPINITKLPIKHFSLSRHRRRRPSSRWTKRRSCTNNQT
jgi:hypothetical protein